jgi:TIR domain
MSGIFLSYRRDDASGWAGRLYEHLVAEWGPDQVFIDIDAIAPGEDFREAIARTMQACDVVLVVIGPNWINALDHDGKRRLDDESDTHRQEVVAALQADVRVVPVLVGGAGMPKLSELPEPLRDLAYRNAAVVADRRFASDVQTLQDTLKEFVRSQQAKRAASEDAPTIAKVRGLHRPDRPSRAGRGAGVDARRVSSEWAPVTLAIAGILLALIWGVFVPRNWHPELWGLRVGAVVFAVVLAGFGLWSRRWMWVLAAGVGGLVGLGIWILQLLRGHTGAELLSPETTDDGVPNLIMFVGVLLILVGGMVGTRARST